MYIYLRVFNYIQFYFYFYKFFLVLCQICLVTFDSPLSLFYIFSLLNFLNLLILESEREREISVCCSTFWCSHWLPLVWQGMEPATLTYQDNALTNWATQPGNPFSIFYLFQHFICSYVTFCIDSSVQSSWRFKSCLFLLTLTNGGWLLYGYIFSLFKNLYLIEFKLSESLGDWVKKALLSRGFAFPSAGHTGVIKLGHFDLFPLFEVFKIRCLVQIEPETHVTPGL